MKRYLRNQDAMTGIVVAGFTALYFSQTFGIRVIPILSGSSAMIPRMCCFFMFGLSVALVVQGIRQEIQNPAPEPSAEERTEKKRQYRAVTTALLILFVAILLLDPLGFILSMSLYLMASFWTLTFPEDRNIPLFAGIAVGSVVLIYAVFVYGFDLLLPAGILG